MRLYCVCMMGIRNASSLNMSAVTAGYALKVLWWALRMHWVT